MESFESQYPTRLGVHLARSAHWAALAGKQAPGQLKVTGDKDYREAHRAVVLVDMADGNEGGKAGKVCQTSHPDPNYSTPNRVAPL